MVMAFAVAMNLWILDEFPTIEVAEKEKMRLTNEGFRHVRIEEVAAKDADALRAGGLL